jgi:hypothetical protein
MAQYYGVFDFRKIPPATAAVLAAGLPDNSRVKLALSGEKYGFEQRLMMMIYDRVNWLQWSRSKASEHGEPPLPLEEQLRQSIECAEERQLMGFDDPDELLDYLKKQRGEK